MKDVCLELFKGYNRFFFFFRKQIQNFPSDN